MATTKETPKKRIRLPMDKFKAAAAIDRILTQIQPQDRAAVLQFVREPPQTEIPFAGG